MSTPHLDPTSAAPDADRAHDVPPSRREVLRSAGVVTIAGVTVTVLAGCGGGQSGSGSSTTGTTPPNLNDAAKAAIAQAVKAGEVPVGKAKILPAAGVIVSQPTAGNYVALSNICPHAGGKISDISSRGFLHCPLHGSEFDPATGEVKVGPSNKPLGTQKIKVDGDKVTAV